MGWPLIEINMFLIIFIFQRMHKIRNTMPAPPLAISDATAARLGALGLQIRTRRKAQGLSATVVAEAAGLSRVTLHRLEKGAPAVTMAAYLNVMGALGLDFNISLPATKLWLRPLPITPAGFRHGCDWRITRSSNNSLGKCMVWMS